MTDSIINPENNTTVYPTFMGAVLGAMVELRKASPHLLENFHKPATIAEANSKVEGYTAIHLVRGVGFNFYVLSMDSGYKVMRRLPKQ